MVKASFPAPSTVQDQLLEFERTIAGLQNLGADILEEMRSLHDAMVRLIELEPEPLSLAAACASLQSHAKGDDTSQASDHTEPSSLERLRILSNEVHRIDEQAERVFARIHVRATEVRASVAGLRALDEVLTGLSRVRETSTTLGDEMG